MKYFLTYMLFLLFSNLYSQNIWEFSGGKNKIVIPFQLVNNNIILQPKINDVTLNMILDTGSAYTILFAFPKNDSIPFYHTYKIKLTGPGMNEPIEAYISKSNSLSFKNFSSSKLDIILMLKEKFNFTTSLGIPIHGVLGADFFSENIIEIQYDTKRILVYKKELKALTKKMKQYKKIALLLKDKKPFIPVAMNFENKKIQKLDLLIDTGLSDGLWVFENELNIKEKKCIDDFLGAGIGGNVYGKRLRFQSINFSGFEFKNSIISLPDTLSFFKKNIFYQRDGSVGGEILKRFNVIFDYQKQFVYLQPNAIYEAKFYYNMAGFDVCHNGVEVVEELIRSDSPDTRKKLVDFANNDGNISLKYVLKPAIQISQIRKNSIADKAGLLVDDKIVSINKVKAVHYNLNEVYDMVYKNSNQKLRLEIEREGKILNFELLLQEEI